MNLRKILSATIFALVFTFGCFLILRELQKPSNTLDKIQVTDPRDIELLQASEMPEFYLAVKNDFKNLRATSNRQTFLVSEVVWHIHDSRINVSDLSLATGFLINSESPITVEAEVFSQPSEENNSTVMQLSYFDKKSKNKIFELSRVYEYKVAKGKDKKKPD
jgi:hypothetical protein